MEFDEYEYLEKTVENPTAPMEEEPLANGIRSDDAGPGKSSKRAAEELDGDTVRAAQTARSEDAGAPRHDDLPREKNSSHRRSSEEHGSRNGERSERDRHRKEDKDKERESDRELDKERIRDRDREMEMEHERSRRSRSRSERHRDEERERSRRSRSRSDRHHDEEWDRSRRSRSRSERYHDEERERSRRSRSRSERHREEELERSRRSRSRSEKYHGEERDRYRERSTDRELRERERELREREARRYKEKKEEVAEPEADPERDQRTVFAYQINLKADERDVYEFFSRAGKVRDVRLIMDRNSRRSKGVGYIEFYDVMSVPMAIALSGQPLLGQPVMVKPSEAEKNLVQSTTTAAGGTGPASGVARRLYAGNLPMNITEDQLRQVFEPFGPVELVQLPLDLETRQCKGYGFIQFARLEDARAAQSLNGQLEIAGRTIKVSSVSEHVGMQDVGTNAGDLDDDEGGLALNAQSRALLMQKLDRSGIVTSVATSLATNVAGSPALSVPAVPILSAAAALPVVAPPVPADIIGPPSECLLLKNMFDPSVETEPDFDMDIKEDVQEECSKFGTIKHIFVDKNSAGFVYLRFDKAASAVGAQRALHGRWFAGKMISATFMLPQAYSAKFPGTG